MHLVFAGGTTGGHLFPGLAVAEQLVAWLPGTRVTFAGSGRAFERSEVTSAGFAYLTLDCHRLPRRAGEAWSFLSRNLSGYLGARRFLRRRQVDCVIGLGGFASVPMAQAAVHRGIPLVLLEQNVVAGAATRWLAPWAKRICVALPGTRRGWNCSRRVRVTGNPLRRPLMPALSMRVNYRKSRPKGLDWRTQGPGRQSLTMPASLDQDSPSAAASLLSSAPCLLVLGGSQGARCLNEAVPPALAALRDHLHGWQILHQAGSSDCSTTGRLYRQLALPATVTPFVAELPQLLERVQLAISRAGGMTLSELAAAGVPAVLVPYPHAAGNHQLRNARVYAAAGAALCVEQGRCDRLAERLAAVLSTVLADPQRRQRMSESMRGLARTEATSEVSAVILEVIGRGSPETARRPPVDRSRAALSGVAGEGGINDRID